jgi:hypothetical protein
MGELITKTSSLDEWIQRIDNSRSQLIKAAESGNRVLAAFAQADARADLLESLKNEAIAAKLLRITAPDIGLVELANNPTDEDRIRIAGIALLNGFVPGDDQYAIFGAGRDRDGRSKPGKLYIKENGFRKLFSHLGIVPQVEIGHPEFADLGTKDSKGQPKKIWQVAGKAFCKYNGQEYCVTFSKVNPIGLPGYESDNVAGIAAKARRRMLQSLWQVVSPVLQVEPIDDDGNDLSEVVEPMRIESQSAARQITERERERMVADDQIARAYDMVKGMADHQEFVRRSVEGINEANDPELLREVGKLMGEEKRRLKISERVMDILRQLYEVRQKELAEESV